MNKDTVRFFLALRQNISHEVRVSNDLIGSLTAEKPIKLLETVGSLKIFLCNYL